MFWTVTLNAVLDHVYQVSGEATDAPVAEQSEHLAAGKGVNVSRALACLGHTSVAVVLCGPDSASHYRAELRSLGVTPRLVAALPGTRQHVTVLGLDPPLHVRERGSPATPDAPARLAGALADIRAGDDIAICGSAAPGLYDAYLGHLTRSLSDRGARVWIDTSGSALRAVLGVGAFGVKVNAGEMGEALGRPVPDRGSAAAVVRGLLADGLALVCLTLGTDGVVLGYRGSVVHAPSPAVARVSAVGSGDAVLAALMARLTKSADAAELAAAGVAAGAANVTTTRPGSLDRRFYRALLASTAPRVRPS